VASRKEHVIRIRVAGKAMSLDYILGQCGQPQSKKEYTKLNSTSSSQQWTYYKTNNPNDPDNPALPKSKLITKRVSF